MVKDAIDQIITEIKLIYEWYRGENSQYEEEISNYELFMWHLFYETEFDNNSDKHAC